MNKKLQYILEIIQQSEKLKAGQKEALVKAVRDADKELEITVFKLERTEKVKKTTAILLEETIEELEQKRKAVEEKNRELEIEASLERVRTVAMGMSKSEDLLSICEVSFRELQKLGFDNLRNAVIHVHNDEQKYFMDYDFSDFTGGQIGKVEYGLHPIVDEYLEKIRSAEDAFFEVVIAEDMLEEWNEFRRKSGQMNDQRLDEADALYYYLFSIGIGDIGISTFKPIKDSQIKILKRFRNVFDLAYRRYNDIITAEAQAREAQIEAALERVRAKAMAMNSSEDLTQTADTFFSELVKLNITPHRCGFGIVDKETRITEIHATTATKDKSLKIVTGKLKLDDHPILEKIFEGYEKQEEYHPVLRGKEISDYYEVMNPQVEFPDFADDEVQYGYYFYFKEGGVFAWNDAEFTENELEIFRRYKSVLSLTYRRFIDLKDAEAQAKEAQIEAALERVRSRSMGMQKSEELKEVIQVVYEQLLQLNINIEHTGFIMDYKTRDDMHIWLADRNEVPSEIVIPYFDSPHWNSFNEAKSNGIDFFANHLSFEEKNKFYQDLFEYIPEVQEETKKYYFNCPGLAISTVLLDNVGLYIENFSGTPYSDEENKLLMRFGKVFQQTYTRFLDLQKAEAQARESQIEAALEKVRARAMGMHKSKEVGEVSDLLFSELNKLSLDLHGCSLVVIDEENDNMELWRARSNVAIKPFEGTSFAEAMNIFKKHLPDFFPKFHNAVGKRKGYLIDELSGKRRLQFINAITEQYNYSSSEKSKLIKNTPETITTHYIFFKLGWLALLGKKQLSDEDLSTTRRFVEVFEFSYTRFLDIKKAEQQTREAQIEAALERVRSRSMAMRKSEELADLSFELVKQVHALGIDSWFCAFNIYDDDPRGSLEWGSNAHGTYEEYRTPREGIFLRYYEAGQKGESLLINEIDEDECPRHYEYLCTLPGVGEQLLQMKDAGLPFPTSQIDHVAYFKYGYIIFITFEPALEAHNTFKRFAKVFEQSYTRFLDLQKAEEQVRLAEQQASLDRVRAEIASMRTTDDLEKITPLIWRELTTLGIPFFRCGVFIFDEPNAIAHAYLSTPLGKSLAALHVKINDTWLENAIKHWRQAKIYHEIWDREQFIAWTQTMMDQGFVESKEQFQAGKEAPEILSLQLFPFNQGMLYVGSKHPLSEEEIKTAQKLADSFGVAYARYEDFQKLEAANHRKSLELEEARQLQLAMLPKELPQLPNLDIAVYMQTATEVGGDYYDFNVGENGELTAVIGDATGHGMKAGTIVTITKSLFNSLAHDDNILNTFSKISKVIKDMKFKQLSMCLMMLKIHKNKIIISSAAMPPALIYRKKKNIVEEIELKGMPLGAMENFPYEIKNTSINSGDTILLMSDGLPELHNGTNKMYGYDRIINEFNSVGNKAPEKIIDHLKKSAAKWINGNDPDDDITFVVIKVK
jgi:serine phosphatase RsbU (regulator of sigma subunit)